MTWLGEMEKDEMRVYIAMVGRDLLRKGEEHRAVKRTAFTGTDKAGVVESALKQKDEWERETPGTSYKVFLGALDMEVRPIVNWQEIPYDHISTGY